MKSPVIILVNPQMPENIGAVCRSMMNFGFQELRLVQPREDWLCEKSIATSAGADIILKTAKVFDDFESAIGDLAFIYATGAAHYEMVKPRWTFREFTSLSHKDENMGILFGPERTGLSQDIIARCHGILTIPTVSDFSSLNLAQSVLAFVYEWFQNQTIDSNLTKPYWGNLHDQGSHQALQKDIDPFLQFLETELDSTHFWRVDHKKPIMKRNLWNIFTRMNLSLQEVRTLFGMVKSLRYEKDDE